MQISTGKKVSDWFALGHYVSGYPIRNWLILNGRKFLENGSSRRKYRLGRDNCAWVFLQKADQNEISWNKP